MHIHKPKAAHGVREFLSEIAVIVVGILIAIGIEQAVEAWHWAREVREARASLHREMDRTNEFFATRVAAEPCQKRRLDDTLAAIVEKNRTPRAGAEGPPVPFDRKLARR